MEEYERIQSFVQKEAKDIATQVIQDTLESDQYRVSQVQSHVHDGIGSQQIPFFNLSGKILTVHWTIPGSQAATASNYGTFWTAPYPCTVIGMTEVHEVAGTAGGAVTLQLERLQGTEAPGAGDDILVSGLNLKATANTVQEAVITPVRDNGTSNANLQVGDRLCLKDSGTLTNLSNVQVVVLITY